MNNDFWDTDRITARRNGSETLTDSLGNSLPAVGAFVAYHDSARNIGGGGKVTEVDAGNSSVKISDAGRNGRRIDTDPRYTWYRGVCADCDLPYCECE